MGLAVLHGAAQVVPIGGIEFAEVGCQLRIVGIPLQQFGVYQERGTLFLCAVQAREHAPLLPPIDGPVPGQAVAVPLLEQVIHSVHIAAVAVLVQQAVAQGVATIEQRVGLGYPAAQVVRLGEGKTVFVLSVGKSFRFVVFVPCLGIFVVDTVAVATEAVFGVCLHEVHLFLQFLRVGPVVVALAHRHILRLGGGYGCVHHPSERTMGLAVQVLRFVDRVYEVGIFFGIHPNDIGGLVGRGIVMHHHHKREIGLLHYKSLKTVPQVGRMVINQTINCKNWSTGHGLDTI